VALEPPGVILNSDVFDILRERKGSRHSTYMYIGHVMYCKCKILGVKLFLLLISQRDVELRNNIPHLEEFEIKIILLHFLATDD
jgi:hypothetical protein